MAIFSKQQELVMMTRHYSAKMQPLVLLSILIPALTLSACQTAPNSAAKPSGVNTGTVTTTTHQAQDSIDEANDYPIEPYVPPPQTSSPNPLTEQTPATPQQLPEILSNNSANSSSNNSSPTPVAPPSTPIITTPSRDDYMISQPPTPPSHNELLERARQNSQQQSRQPAANNSSLHAFQNLMQSGMKQLKAGNLNAAESSFTRAQRLAPKSSAVYFYLSQVALKKKQPRKAEAMARRGLSVSNDTSRRRSLWQLILSSGQQQNNPRVIKEAQQALR